MPSRWILIWLCLGLLGFVSGANKNQVSRSPEKVREAILEPKPSLMRAPASLGAPVLAAVEGKIWEFSEEMLKQVLEARFATIHQQTSERVTALSQPKVVNESLMRPLGESAARSWRARLVLAGSAPSQQIELGLMLDQGESTLYSMMRAAIRIGDDWIALSDQWEDQSGTLTLLDGRPHWAFSWGRIPEHRAIADANFDSLVLFVGLPNQAKPSRLSRLMEKKPGTFEWAEQELVWEAIEVEELESTFESYGKRSSRLAPEEEL